MNTNKAKQFKRPIAAILLITALLAGCTSLKDSRQERYTEKRQDRSTSIIAKRLDLSKEQEQVLEETASDIRNYIISSSVLTEKEREEIKNAVKAEELDTATLARIRKAHADDMLEMRTVILENIGKFHRVLTEQQRELLAEMLAER
jgi:uncharacterized membrane protein